MWKACVLSMVAVGLLPSSCAVGGLGALGAGGVALRAVQTLEVRTRAEHGRMLEDTQSLADEYGNLVLENADRVAEIAALKADLAALRDKLAVVEGALTWAACCSRRWTGPDPCRLPGGS